MKPTYPVDELKKLRKSGLIEDALNQGKQLMNQYPNDKFVKSEYAWVLYDKLKTLQVESFSEALELEEYHDRIRKLFHQYFQLELEKPNLQFSLMIVQLVRLQPLPSFTPKMIQFAGVESFREEDFQNNPTEDPSKVFPSLVGRLAGAMGKLVASSPKNFDQSIHEFTLEFIKLAMTKSQIIDPVWLRYRMGLILIELKRFEEAQQHIEYVVKKKNKDFWAWKALAHCHQSKSPQQALSIFVKAFRVASDKKFAVKVLYHITQLALNLGNSILAKWSIKQEISIREMAGYSVPDSTTLHCSSDWYSTTDIPENMEEILLEHEHKAESVFFKDQWFDANFLEIITLKNGKKMLKLAYQSETTLKTTLASFKRFSR